MNLIVVFTLLYEDRIHFSILYSINLIFSVFFLFVCLLFTLFITLYNNLFYYRKRISFHTFS